MTPTTRVNAMNAALSALARTTTYTQRIVDAMEVAQGAYPNGGPDDLPINIDLIVSDVVAAACLMRLIAHTLVDVASAPDDATTILGYAVDDVNKYAGRVAVITDAAQTTAAAIAARARAAR